MSAALQQREQRFQEYQPLVQTIQREKEAGVKAVSSALARSDTFAKLDPAHLAASHLHMGATCMVEQMAVTLQSRFARFAPSPKWRLPSMGSRSAWVSVGALASSGVTSAGFAGMNWTWKGPVGVGSALARTDLCAGLGLSSAGAGVVSA
mgnify:CR=1 FL=1